VKQLDIILRTYDGDSVHPRRFDKPKKDIVWRCVRSLCTAIKALPEQPRLTILDDHSTHETVQFLRNETIFLGKNVTIQTLKGTGNNDSMLEALTLAKESTADLVYVIGRLSTLSKCPNSGSRYMGKIQTALQSSFHGYDTR
jgi:hypothetical protein